MNHVIHSYINLAAAIIKSGERYNDVDFLKSEWCQELRYIVEEYLSEQDMSSMKQRLNSKEFNHG